MRRHGSLIPIAVGLLVLTSCTPGGGPDEHGAPEARVEDRDDAGDGVETEGRRWLIGHAVHGHEVRSFRPCGSDEALWAIDESGLLWDVHGELVPGPEPYEEVFAVVEGRLAAPPEDGFGADYPGAVLVDRVLYVAWEGLGCDAGWDRFRYRAFGNEPFWTVEISNRGMRLTRPGYPDVMWPVVKEEGAGDDVHFRGTGGDEPPMAIAIMSAPCRDSMSGAFSAFTAVLSLGSEMLTGCAVMGNERPER